MSCEPANVDTEHCKLDSDFARMRMRPRQGKMQILELRQNTCLEQVRMMKEERAAVEGALEEARSRELEQRSRADSLKQEVEAQRSQVQRHLTQVPPHALPPPCTPLGG